jgi:hypothetical protein
MKSILLLIAAGAALSAQAPRAQGYAFASVDNPNSGDFHYNAFGAGADLFVYKGLAVSPSGGYLFARDNGLTAGAAVITANGSYHFLRGRSRVEPFITAGYGTLANFGESISMFNYGGGAQFWFHKRMGVRVELLNFQSGGYRELTSIRFGFAFR